MSHDAKSLLNREVQIMTNGNTAKNRYRVVATSNNERGVIYAYLMSDRGLITCKRLKDLKFTKVWNYESGSLMDSK